MVYRYTISTKHNLDRLSDMFYWPALDLFLWGLTGIYFAKISGDFKGTTYVLLTGLVFWIVVWRAQYEINTNFLDELWDKNIVNLFASPLTIYEWILSVIIFGFIKMIASLLFSALLAYMFFGYNILLFGTLIFPIVANLVLSGWAGGFFVGGFLTRFGVRIQTMAWAGVALLAPFSALYFPISILPSWAQQITHFVPPSYMFEGMRQYLTTGTFPINYFLIALALNLFYLVLSITFFVNMFNQSRKLGLGRLI